MPPEVRIVHCADVHLDSSFRGSRLSAEAAHARAEELKQTFERIVAIARSERADALLVAGDLFEAETVRKQTVLRAMELFESLAPAQVFVAPGNHDPFMESSYYAALRWPANVTVFGPEWRAVEVRSCGAFVHGWGFPSPYVSARRLAELRIADGGTLNIVLLHGSDDAFPSDERWLPLSREECLSCGADYVALGHFHVHRVVAERSGTLAAYPGAPEALDFGQTPPYGVLVGTISREGNSLALERVGTREYRSLELDVTGAKTPEAIVERLLAVAPAEERRRHFYRIELGGEVDPALEVRADEMARTLSERREFHHIELRDLTRPDYDLEALERENTLRGRFVARLRLELRSAAGGKAEREIELALRFGLRALEEGERR